MSYSVYVGYAETLLIRREKFTSPSRLELSASRERTNKGEFVVFTPAKKIFGQYVVSLLTFLTDSERSEKLISLLNATISVNLKSL